MKEEKEEGIQEVLSRTQEVSQELDLIAKENQSLHEEKEKLADLL